MNMPAAESNVESPVVETPVEATPEAQAAEAMVDLEDVMGDPTPEEMTVQPAAGEPAAPVAAQPVDAGAKAVQAAAESVEDELPKQREDGKFAFGKFVANSMPELIVKINKARDHAERYAGQKSPTDPFVPIDPETGEPAVTTGNPFSKADDELEEFNADEPFEQDDFETQLAQGVAQQLAPMLTPPQQQQVPQGVDPIVLQQQQAQVYQVANQVVNSPEASPADFKAVLQNLVLYSPGDKPSRDAVLQEWAERPGQQIAAFNEAMEIDRAFQQIATEQHNQQMLAQAQQQYEADLAVEQQMTAQEQANSDAWTAAWGAFEQQNRAKLAQHNDGMNTFLSANQKLMERAKGDPEAIYSVLDTALQIAEARGGAAPAQAGVVPGASEQGSNMSNVNVIANQDPAAIAAAQAAHDQQVDWATLETGVDAGGPIDVTVTNPLLAKGAAEIPLGDLIGIPLVS